MATLSPASSLADLSPRQRELFTFIVRFLREEHYPPTMHEAAAALGLSDAMAMTHLDRIVTKGVVDRKPKVVRALWLTPAGLALAAELDAAPASAEVARMDVVDAGELAEASAPR